MAVCFSFDVEYHDRIEAAVGIDSPPELRAEYADRMERCSHWLLEVLSRHGSRCTFFVVGEIATRHPALIREMAAAGHEVACHSWSHENVHRLTPETFRDDLRRARSELEQASGQAVRGYRAPTFSITRRSAWAIDVLAEEGMLYDSSIFPVRHDRYGVPDAPRVPFLARGKHRELIELPPTTYAVLGKNLPAAGGGYFRLYPPSIIRAAIRQTLRLPGGLPVLYFHPWEFDPDQPRLPLGRLNRFRTYVGIRKARQRLESLLGLHKSVPMIEAVEALNPTELPRFSLED